MTDQKQISQKLCLICRDENVPRPTQGAFRCDNCGSQNRDMTSDLQGKEEMTDQKQTLRWSALDEWIQKRGIELEAEVRSDHHRMCNELHDEAVSMAKEAAALAFEEAGRILSEVLTNDDDPDAPIYALHIIRLEAKRIRKKE